MTTYVVYKLTRSDGKIYIGITEKHRFKKRINEHKVTTKFKGYGFFSEILEENPNYDYICKKEEEYIKLYDSYFNGLNNTLSGKGQSDSVGRPKFTTKGFKFSEESKKKMSETRKRLFAEGKLKAWNKGQVGCFSSESLQKMSHNNKVRRHSKLTKEEVTEILEIYFLKPKIEGVGKPSKNGRPMSYDVAFSNLYAPKYNVTPNNIKNIIQGKNWKDVYSKFN